jgi:thiaminase
MQRGIVYSTSERGIDEGTRHRAGRGLSPDDLEQTLPAVELLAYTRYVLDTGMRGDLLAAPGGAFPLR